MPEFGLLLLRHKVTTSWNELSPIFSQWEKIGALIKVKATKCEGRGLTMAAGLQRLGVGGEFEFGSVCQFDFVTATLA